MKNERCRRCGRERTDMGNKQESNEVMYKIALHLLSKMQESGIISAEEREKINVLNMETFSPSLAKVYL